MHTVYNWHSVSQPLLSFHFGLVPLCYNLCMQAGARVALVGMTEHRLEDITLLLRLTPSSLKSVIFLPCFIVQL